MDNGSKFPYRFCGGKGGTRVDKLSVPTGHGASSIIGDAGAGKSTPDVIADGGRKLKGDQIQFSRFEPPRKASLPLKQERPYRKPTLVG
jgi:hypothetical protein